MAPKRHVRGSRKRKRTNASQKPALKRQKEIKQFGAANPSANKRSGVRANYTNVLSLPSDSKGALDISSSEEETDSPYQMLLTSVSNKSATGNKAPTTAESDESDELSDESLGDDDDNDDEIYEEEDESMNDIHDKHVDEEEEDSAEEDLEDVEEDYEDSDDALGEDDTSSEKEEEEKSDEEILDDKDQKEDFLLKENDPFSVHFEKDLDDEYVDKLTKKDSWTRKELRIPHIGRCVRISAEALQTNGKLDMSDLKKLHVKHKLAEEVEETNRKLCKVDGMKKGEPLTSFQLALFKILNNYEDLYMSERSHLNGEEIRIIYCLHALNHVLKTRSRVIVHNSKLKEKKPGSVNEEYRDQGLTRPKVLVVVPFRDSALRIVNIMMKLLMSSDQKMVSNKKRFQSEYGEEGESNKKGFKPEDYEATFTGNIDDHFRIGIGVAKKTLKLYTPFYTSDIIIASPLGLRTIIGSEGDKERDYDFLNSIEVLIFDQTDVFLMQNWEHILHLMNHLHLQPQEPHGVDFSRVRMWTLNGWSKFYRQTMIFSSIATPELNALFNKHCTNYGGKLKVCRTDTKGTICHIVSQLPQVFHRFECSSFSEVADKRFEFFIKKVLPQHKDPVMSQTFVFIPSYFDFVRIRNYFVREDIDFVHLNEYSKDKAISRGRTHFFHGKAHFMLYTERLHFYRRFKIRGIRHLVFYELPQYPVFYSEICNMVQDTRMRTDKESMTCTVIYSQYDIQKLAEVVGTNRASHMLNSDKKVHMFVTGEDT